MTNTNPFDLYEPLEGHQERFERRLKKTQSQRTITLWKYSLVAGFALLIGVFSFLYQPKSYELADASPKMKTTQDYFEGMIAEEKAIIEKTDFTNHSDLKIKTFQNLERLENDYNQLKKQIKAVGYNSKIVHAMIVNFQQRLEILENLNLIMQQNEKLKSETHENNNI